MIKRSPIYFIGIGGIGMSALARYFLSQKCPVHGSDASRSVITDSLRKSGLNVKIGQKRANLPAQAQFVVVSQAIRADNQELIEAKRRKWRIFTYPEIIGALTREYKTIAIAGAHGKSTTTALAALALIQCGLNPTVIVGTNLKEFNDTNFRLGGVAKDKEQYLVLEADEYGRAFLNYSPFVAIVTNVDREHLDVYKSFTNVANAFIAFLKNVREGGALILNRDDKHLFALRKKIDVITKKKNLRVLWYSLRGGANTARAKKMKHILQIPGEHNVSNAMAVSALGNYFHLPEKKIMKALTAYHGSWRRFEYRGSLGIKGHALKVFDDYAHHPTEIKATLKAFKEKFPKEKIVCVFQPHQAERLRLLFKDFINAFENADQLILIPSYRVAGRDTKSAQYTAKTLAAAIKKKYPKQTIDYLKNPRSLKSHVIKTAPRTGVIVMMGAGDIVSYTDSLLK